MFWLKQLNKLALVFYEQKSTRLRLVDYLLIENQAFLVLERGSFEYLSFKVAPYSFLKSGKHMFQTQNLVHWYFVRRMKLNF